MKVYCKNCKWLIGTLYCNQKTYRGGINLSKREKEDVMASWINQDNNCPYYHHKWYKFWIKKGGFDGNTRLRRH